MGSVLPTAQMGVDFAHFHYGSTSPCHCVLASGQVAVYRHLLMEPQGCTPLMSVMCHSASVIKAAITTKEQQAQEKEIIGDFCRASNPKHGAYDRPSTTKELIGHT